LLLCCSALIRSADGEIYVTSNHRLQMLSNSYTHLRDD